jgi:hypothetical protein
MGFAGIPILACIHSTSIDLLTGEQNLMQALMQAVHLVNPNLSSWNLRLDAFAKSGLPHRLRVDVTDGSVP